MGIPGHGSFPERKRLAGVPAAQFWPFVRPVDGLASNSYVIATPDLFLVIDPGADADQSRRIMDLRASLPDPSAEPVLLLTHCHRDHSLAVSHWGQAGTAFRVLAHEDGASALQAGDEDRTLAYLYGESSPRLEAVAPLAVPDGHRVLELGTSVRLDVYCTPGHSPDSLCFLLGDHLFLGDILFADKPGVAGIPGWSQTCLLRSLDTVERLIRKKGVAQCCPGHGPMVPAEDVLRLIGSARKNAASLQRLVCLDAERVSFLRTCAEAFVGEAGFLFSVLGGRLHLLAQRLEDLGETELAEALVRGIDLEQMEGFVRDFQLSGEGSSKSVLKMQRPLMAVGTVGRIRRVFRDACLPEGIEEALLQQIEWLLRDYLSITVGMDVSDHLVDADIRDVLREAMAVFAPFEWGLDDDGDAERDPAAFAVVLARALAFRPELPPVEIVGDAATFPIRTDPHRLALLFSDVLGQLSAASAILVRVEAEGDRLLVRFSVGEGVGTGLSPRKARYYASGVGLLGGGFGHRGDGKDLCFSFPRAGTQNHPEPLES